MALKFPNRARMTTATTGTGTLTLGAAVASPSRGYFQSFADAGVANADTVRYVIEDGANWEIGTGTYTASGTTLSRSVIESSNADAAINLSGGAEIYATVIGADIALGTVDAKTADYTILLSDRGKAITVSASGAARTITLPAAATAGNGFGIIVKKTDSSANTITIDGNGSETIDGALTKVLRLQHQSIALNCDGGNWQVLSQSAVFEEGSNANGDYVRFAGGFQICTRGVTWVPNAGVTQVFDMPAVFVTPDATTRPGSSIGFAATGTTARHELFKNTSVATPSFGDTWNIIINPASTISDALPIGLMATGRWY